jgi:regulator of replication initiation timing
MEYGSLQQKTMTTNQEKNGRSIHDKEEGTDNLGHIYNGYNVGSMLFGIQNRRKIWKSSFW